MNQKLRNSLLLLLTAIIWGLAFVAQSEGGDAIGPFSFNCIRCFLGGVVLLPVIKVLDRLNPNNRRPRTPEDKRRLLKTGIICGVVMFIASTSQQMGINYGTGAGKAGFITACYILIVPVLGIFLKRKCPWNVWVGVVIALVGLYMLCMGGEGFDAIRFCDLLVLVCAFTFSIHIMVVDRFSPLVDGVRLSSLQFVVCGTLGILPMIFVEMRSMGLGNWFTALCSSDALISIFYAGVMSCGVAYTLQIIGQNGLNPTVASMIMSLESAFAVIGGALILGERMSRGERMGCVLIFAAILLAQVTFPKKE